MILEDRDLHQGSAVELPLVVLHLHQDRVIRLTYRQQGAVQDLVPAYPTAVQELIRLVDTYPAAYIAWYDERLAPYLSAVAAWPRLIRHPLEVLHISCLQRGDLLVRSLGLVDFESPFLLPGPTDRRYGTWLISAICGIAQSPLLRAIGIDPTVQSFPGALLDFGLRGAQQGVLAYSEPRLVAHPIPPAVIQTLHRPLSSTAIATLIGRNYKKKWLLFWLLGSLWLNRSLPVIAVLKAWRVRAAPPSDPQRMQPLHPALESVIRGATVDVIIPTMGRPLHLLNLLHDLSVQTTLPRKVTIIEQSPAGEEYRTLPEFSLRAWPFEIHHDLVRWVGACRARNLGLREVGGEWVLLLDDDIRVTPQFICYLLQVARAYQVDGVSSAVYLPHQRPASVVGSALPRIWPAFASGASLVSARAMRAAGPFDERLEGGYGEDYEFGVRLRLTGATVMYAPGEPVLHLKAPAGGFRYAFAHPWRNEKIQPKPSPIMLYSRQKHTTTAMQKGYRIFYYLNRLTATPYYRWPGEALRIARQWRSAMRWVTWLSGQ